MASVAGRCETPDPLAGQEPSGQHRLHGQAAESNRDAEVGTSNSLGHPCTSPRRLAKNPYSWRRVSIEDLTTTWTPAVTTIDAGCSLLDANPPARLRILSHGMVLPQKMKAYGSGRVRPAR